VKTLQVVSALLLSAAVTAAFAQDKPKAMAKKAAGPMTFFVTSVGKGDGANLGGLDGADAHCNALAAAAGSRLKNWKAYLSTTMPGGDEGVNARSRIGKGPWRNAKGVTVANNVAHLHSARNNLTKQTAITEKGEAITGSGDTPNKHDILTGSDPQGMYSTAGGDTHCGNWTKNAEGSAIVGHHDRIGLKKTTRHMASWNSSHGSRGCSQENLVSTGGAGLFYCFAAN
jgi:hypothetical protein